VAILPIFCFECIWKVVLVVQILKFQVRETFIYPQFIKVPSVLLYNEIYLLDSNLNLRLSNLYARYLLLAIWSLNYKIRVHRTIFFTPKHLTTVTSDLFYDEIWSRFDLSLSKIVGRYLKDFNFLALMIF
jgi:hypothetical protein